VTAQKIMLEIGRSVKALPTQLFGVAESDYSRKDLLRIIAWLGMRANVLEKDLEASKPKPAEEPVSADV